VILGCTPICVSALCVGPNARRLLPPSVTRVICAARDRSRWKSASVIFVESQPAQPLGPD